VTTIKIDFEHNCERFWDLAHRELAPEHAETIRHIERTQEARLSDSYASEFLAACSLVPGYDEDPFVTYRDTPEE
jgi:hypothetical protein